MSMRRIEIVLFQLNDNLAVMGSPDWVKAVLVTANEKPDPKPVNCFLCGLRYRPGDSILDFLHVDYPGQSDTMCGMLCPICAQRQDLPRLLAEEARLRFDPNASEVIEVQVERFSAGTHGIAGRGLQPPGLLPRTLH